MALYYPNQEFKTPKFFDPAAIALWSPGPMKPNMDYTPPGPSRLGRNPNGDPDPNKRYTVQKRGNIPNKASASPASDDIDEFEDAQEEPFKLVPEHVNQALNKSPRKRERSEKYTPPGKSRLSKHPGGHPDLGDHGNFQKRGNSIGSFLLGDPLLGSGPHRLVYDEKGSPETVAERATRTRPKQQRNLGYTSPGKSRFSQHPYGNPDSADHHEVQKRSSSRKQGSANPLLDAMEGSSRHTRVRKHRSSPKPTKPTSAAAKAIQKSNTGRKGNSLEWSPPGKSPLGRSSDGEASDEE
ncbi:hypothetical protein MCOR25_008405 [Pyricularia grisea]|nr:hypothetical protein MCOR25_008405 [Pyricularia grisea]